MAHYLPKKKYLQFLNDGSTPPGSNAAPSTPSDDLSDGTGPVTPPTPLVGSQRSGEASVESCGVSQDGSNYSPQQLEGGVDNDSAACSGESLNFREPKQDDHVDDDDSMMQDTKMAINTELCNELNQDCSTEMTESVTDHVDAEESSNNCDLKPNSNGHKHNNRNNGDSVSRNGESSNSCKSSLNNIYADNNITDASLPLSFLNGQSKLIQDSNTDNDCSENEERVKQESLSPVAERSVNDEVYNEDINGNEFDFDRNISSEQRIDMSDDWREGGDVEEMISMEEGDTQSSTIQRSDLFMNSAASDAYGQNGLSEHALLAKSMYSNGVRTSLGNVPRWLNSSEVLQNAIAGVKGLDCKDALSTLTSDPAALLHKNLYAGTDVSNVAAMLRLNTGKAAVDRLLAGRSGILATASSSQSSAIPDWFNTHMANAVLPGIKFNDESLNRLKSGSGLKRRQSNASIGRDDIGNLVAGGLGEDMVCVKEERSEDEDLMMNEYEIKRKAMVTTSGRNRGCGKALEPKYICQVCGDTAAGFHCGAYVCEACKKFYLRCLKSGGTPAFLCPKNNDCIIAKDTRSHCQYCRFQKCVQLGMYKPGREDDKKLKIDFKTIPCKVCNAASSGFHFGAITCEGCKGFFRRMLKEQLHKKFVCTNNETCDIDSANRTTCKCCRFTKCLRIGMKLEGTRLGRQSNSVKRSTLMEYNCHPDRGKQNMIPNVTQNSSSSNDSAERLLQHHVDQFSSLQDSSGLSNYNLLNHRDTAYMSRLSETSLTGRSGLPAAQSSNFAHVTLATDSLQASGVYPPTHYNTGLNLHSRISGLLTEHPAEGQQLRVGGQQQQLFLSGNVDVKAALDDSNAILHDGFNEDSRLGRPRLSEPLKVHVTGDSMGEAVYSGTTPTGGFEGGRGYPGIGSFCKREVDLDASSQHVSPHPVGYRGEGWAEDPGPVIRRWMNKSNINEGVYNMENKNQGYGGGQEYQSPHGMMSPHVARNFNQGEGFEMGGMVQLQHAQSLSHISPSGQSTSSAYSHFSPHIPQNNNGLACQQLGANLRADSHASISQLSPHPASFSPSANQLMGFNGRGLMGGVNGRTSSMADLSISPATDRGSMSDMVSPINRKCRYPSGASQDALDRERQLYQDSLALFRYLTQSFKELNDIMNRPQELDDLQHDQATLDTLWKLVEIPFIHQAKVVLKFVKKIPGFRQLPVDDQIKMAQDSLYPITLIFHSQYYNLETGEFNWFINTPEERDLILSILPPFSTLGNHFRSIGYALKSLALSDEEMAFLTTMTAFTAADGSYLQASKEVEDLKEELLEAFVSYQSAVGIAGNNRLATLLTRLPELKRANIEHRLVATEVQQIVPNVETSNLWQEVFLSGNGTTMQQQQQLSQPDEQQMQQQPQQQEQQQQQLRELQQQ